MADITQERLIEILRARWDTQSARTILKEALEAAGILSNSVYSPLIVERLAIEVRRRFRGEPTADEFLAEAARAKDAPKAAEPPKAAAKAQQKSDGAS
jgi:hypothetical protein